MPDVFAWRFPLPRTTAAVPIARALVRTALTDVPVVHADSETAELLTAELVANAVEHTAGEEPIELVVELLANGCQVEVHDGDPRPPVALGPPGALGPGVHPDDLFPDPWQEHGRGLPLIRALSSACGHRPTADGKAVWFTLAARPA
ncbi:ATP-binding protein [Streptomyces sp. NPDC051109]|uniref:ATP-binding protein n=1 Tax=Streptomyces sp. NPDC051109 TaxID=3365642 RepID=UPI001065D10F